MTNISNFYSKLCKNFKIFLTPFGDKKKFKLIELKLKIEMNNNNNKNELENKNNSLTKEENNENNEINKEKIIEKQIKENEKQIKEKKEKEINLSLYQLIDNNLWKILLAVTTVSVIGIYYIHDIIVKNPTLKKKKRVCYLF